MLHVHRGDDRENNSCGGGGGFGGSRGGHDRSYSSGDRGFGQQGGGNWGGGSDLRQHIPQHHQGFGGQMNRYWLLFFFYSNLLYFVKISFV